MRYKIQTAILGCVLNFTALLSSDAQTALSQNAVGFIRLQLTNDSFYQVTVPFVSLGSPLTPSEVFGDLPNGSSIIFWDNASQSYLKDEASETKLLDSWTPNTNDLYQRSFWLYVGEASAPTSYDAFITGRVPDESTLATQNINLTVSPDTNVVNLVSYAFPADIDWTNSTLAQAASDGSYILIADEQSENLFPVTKSSGNWSSNVVIQAGQSFWFYGAPGTTNNWQETKPYDWP